MDHIRLALYEWMNIIYVCTYIWNLYNEGVMSMLSFDFRRYVQMQSATYN
jgi:hypothetical protein